MVLLSFLGAACGFGLGVTAADSGAEDEGGGSLLDGDADTDSDSDSDSDGDSDGDSDSDADADADADSDADTDADADTDTPRDAGPGDFLINEFLVQPVNLADDKGEWIEIRNLTSDTLNLVGLELADNNGESVTIDLDDTVAPGALAVLCRSNDGHVNGGVDCTWGWNSNAYQLANGSDAIVIKLNSSQIDRVEYSSSWLTPGRALGVTATVNTTGDNDAKEAWCAQSTAINSDNTGTPGSANDGC